MIEDIYDLDSAYEVRTALPVFTMFNPWSGSRGTTSKSTRLMVWLATSIRLELFGVAYTNHNSHNVKPHFLENIDSI